MVMAEDCRRLHGCCTGALGGNGGAERACLLGLPAIRRRLPGLMPGCREALMALETLLIAPISVLLIQNCNSAAQKKAGQKDPKRNLEN